ncbi:aspartate dehydrogenase [Methanoregula boonei 6A8]|jgi:aspartate dehydrogenase|uniref:L-aspartate dehydrogenase n=1 Tax=Methanoregula boonei (strain DSM 21154 / JCM 14090 / 6A8) TaxID=456442 RepID=A7I5K7_METB6|nr:aspartate dehydrogenase [Methanoregula boonei]ABS55018.1 aspartate dehydrogenase [Methanoregula boonei 6A8]
MMRIGLLGCGNIGHIIARHAEGFTIPAVYDTKPERAKEIADLCNGKAYGDFAAFLEADTDIVVEAASVGAARAHAQEVLEHKKNLVIMSVGALTDQELREGLVAVARQTGTKIYVPSGAIFGLDNVKIGQISPISKLLLKTTKSPQSLGLDAPIRRRIFSGKAHECIKLYPKNVNVSVAMGLAAGQDADVELWVDPAADKNIHELFIEGDFGETYIRVTNVPSPENPATSYLAALSILSLLKNLDSPLVIGT